MNYKLFKSIIITFCILCSLPAYTKDYLNSETQSLVEGNITNIDICLENTTRNNYTAFQMDVYVPDGFEIEADGITSSSRLTDHMVSAGQQSEQHYRVIAWSANNTAIVGNSGAILSIKLKDKSATSKENQLEIKNICFATRNGEEITFQDLSIKIMKSAPKYSITYQIDGNVYQTDSLHEGEAIHLPETPQKEGHTFIGWEGVPETMPAQDITVNGSFSINSYQITYYLDGKFYTLQNVVYNDIIEAPEVNLTEENQIFLGWEDLPERMPAHNLEIHGATYVDGITNNIKNSSALKIYNLKGIYVGNTSDLHILRSLKQGIYIIGNKIVYIKGKL